MINNNLKDICFIASDYPTQNRPVFVFVQQLLETIVDLGVKVSVVAPQSLTRSLFRGIPIMPRHTTYKTIKGNSYEVYRPYSFSFGNGKKILYKISERYNQRNFEHYLKSINPQVVYGHFWSCAMNALHYCCKNNKPLFVACGESHDLFDKWSAGISSEQKNTIRKYISGVICVSSENKRKCIDNQLCKEENCLVLPNCVDITAFYPQEVNLVKEKLGIKEGDFVIAFVGSFIPRKGPDRVAKAITKLNDTRIKVMFIGQESSGYNYLFECSGIIYKGPVTHEKLPIMLNCADVFVLPTRNEGCSNAIVEALACGIPVISSNGAFNDDILDNRNSIRIDADDIDALADAIAFLQHNPKVRQTMREFSISRHHSYSIENRAGKILGFIESNIQKD